MAIRTSSGAVKSVLMDDYGARRDGTLPDLTPYIETASSVTDDVVVYAAAKGITLNVIKLELIERWLGAHFYVMSDQPYLEKETMQARAKYQGTTGMMLKASKYGQTALLLDTSGTLATMEERKVAGAFWLGKVPSEQLDYYERE